MARHDTVEGHNCVDIVAKFTDEQCIAINPSTAGRFNACKQLTQTLRSKHPTVD